MSLEPLLCNVKAPEAGLLMLLGEVARTRAGCKELQKDLMGPNESQWPPIGPMANFIQQQMKYSPCIK